MMDLEFEKVKDQEGMELVDVNTTTACKHVHPEWRTFSGLTLMTLVGSTYGTTF